MYNYIHDTYFNYTAKVAEQVSEFRRLITATCINGRRTLFDVAAEVVHKCIDFWKVTGAVIGYQ